MELYSGETTYAPYALSFREEPGVREH